MKPPDDWQSIADVVRAARLALTPPFWSFSGSGPEYEVTIRRNRAIFDRLALLPQVLRGAGNPDPSASFLGNTLSLPVMLAPVGTIAMWHPGGAPSSARVAERAGTISFIPSSTGDSLADARAACDGPLVFQLYAYQGDRDWQEGMLRKVEGAGYSAICVTVDSAGGGVRDRPLANRSLWTTGSGALDQSAPTEGASTPAARVRQNSTSTAQASLSWEDLAWLRDRTQLPFILKGIMSPRDAERAVDCGVNAVYVSNHGGRRQDHLPSTMEMLPKVVEAVGGRAEIVVDSGFMRGSDVVKGLALGASAVAVGKLMIWGLAAGGEIGLLRTLELLRTEIMTTMSCVGASTVADLTPDLVIPSFDPPLAPWPIDPMDLLAY